MGKINKYLSEKLVIGVLTARQEQTDRLIDKLKEHFGPIDYRSSLLKFKFTDYYTKEMGQDIMRFFVSFENLIQPDTLSEIKILTNKLEQLFTEDAMRKINLDPGILGLNRFILASTKAAAHRVPLMNGIYAELTLWYVKKKFRPLEWTYPDFRGEEYNKILRDIREIYKGQLKQR